MSMLSRLSILEYQILKNISAPNSLQRITMAQTLLRAIVGTAAALSEPISGATLPSQFLEVAVEWGTGNTEFTLTIQDEWTVTQGISSALVTPTVHSGSVAPAG